MSMDEINKNATVKLLSSLRRKLEPSLPLSLIESQFFVDVADIYEVCIAYTEAVDLILSPEIDDSEKLVDVLYAVDCHLFEHLAYHLESLKELMPQVIDAIESRKSV